MTYRYIRRLTLLDRSRETMIPWFRARENEVSLELLTNVNDRIIEDKYDICGHGKTYGIVVFGSPS